MVLAVAVASTHLVSKGGKRVVASPYAKNFAKELKVNMGPMASEDCGQGC